MNRQIILTITPDEFQALSQAAQREIRPVKDQARFILLSALGMIGPDTPITAPQMQLQEQRQHEIVQQQ